MICPVIVPCGPGELEFNRLVDLTQALSHWEKETWLIVVNDANPFISKDALCKAAPEADGMRIDIIKNPRSGRGWGWSGGLVLGELAALRFIYEREKNIPFVIKSDTDALPVASFSQKLATAFEDSTIGLVGSRIIDEQLPPERKSPPIGYFRNKILKMCAPLALWRKPKWHMRSPFWDKRTKQLRQFILQAIQKGYTPGELIEGGCFAFSPSLIQAICESHIDRQEDMILHLCVSDDLFLTPLAYYFEKRTINSEMFCIEPFGLRYPAEEIASKCAQAAWVHSLKESITNHEVISRQIFKELRKKEFL